MAPAGFELTPANERPQIHALDRKTTGIGAKTPDNNLIKMYFSISEIVYEDGQTLFK